VKLQFFVNMTSRRDIDLYGEKTDSSLAPSKKHL